MNLISHVFASVQILLSLIIQENFVLLPQCSSYGMRASSHRLMGSWMSFNHVFQFYFAFGLPFCVIKINMLFLILRVSYCSKESWLFTLSDIIHNLDMNHRCACSGKRGHFSQSLSTYRTKNCVPLYQPLNTYISTTISIQLKSCQYFKFKIEIVNFC